MKPEILLLDEPTNDLDEKTRTRLVEIFKQPASGDDHCQSRQVIPGAGDNKNRENGEWPDKLKPVSHRSLIVSGHYFCSASPRRKLETMSVRQIQSGSQD